jgi:hypothetical protein
MKPGRKSTGALQGAKRSKLISEAQSTIKRTAEAQSTLKRTAEENKCDFEVNPFGLQEEAQCWLQIEMIPHDKESYLLPAIHYRPLVIKKIKSPIPADQFQKAAAEYEKRSRSSSPEKKPVLVAIGVNDQTMRLFLDDEEGPLKNARYLFFPALT